MLVDKFEDYKCLIRKNNFKKQFRKKREKIKNGNKKMQKLPNSLKEIFLLKEERNMKKEFILYLERESKLNNFENDFFVNELNENVFLLKFFLEEIRTEIKLNKSSDFLINSLDLLVGFSIRFSNLIKKEFFFLIQNIIFSILENFEIYEKNFALCLLNNILIDDYEEKFLKNLFQDFQNFLNKKKIVIEFFNKDYLIYFIDIINYFFYKGFSFDDNAKNNFLSILKEDQYMLENSFLPYLKFIKNIFINEKIEKFPFLNVIKCINFNFNDELNFETQKFIFEVFFLLSDNILLMKEKKEKNLEKIFYEKEVIDLLIKSFLESITIFDLNSENFFFFFKIFNFFENYFYFSDFKIIIESLLKSLRNENWSLNQDKINFFIEQSRLLEKFMYISFNNNYDLEFLKILKKFLEEKNKSWILIKDMIIFIIRFTEDYLEICKKLDEEVRFLKFEEIEEIFDVKVDELLSIFQDSECFNEMSEMFKLEK